MKRSRAVAEVLGVIVGGLVVGAIAGTAGVKPTFAALDAGRAIALANKECLVCAGPAFMRQAALRGIRLLPVDSEHNAIFQALGDEGAAQGGERGDRDREVAGEVALGGGEAKATEEQALAAGCGEEADAKCARNASRPTR